MNLYEFTFIAQQSLLQQEVEGMIQELAVLLKDIKADLTINESKKILDTGTTNLTKQELESFSKKIQDLSLHYFDLMENIAKILWNDTEEDLSNFKEIKARIDKEVTSKLKYSTQRSLELGHNVSSKNELIRKAATSLKDEISKHILKDLQDLLKDVDVKVDSLNLALQSLLNNVEASGLIKHEYWGLLDFAYPINKMKSGNYCILCIISTPAIMDEFTRKVKLNENILRYLSLQVNTFFKGKSYMVSKQVEEQNI